jgi:hypothetical protein
MASGRPINLTGQKIKTFEVLEGKEYVGTCFKKQCRCTECGDIRMIPAQALRRGACKCKCQKARKGQPLFNVWHRLMNKHKICEHWEVYAHFIADVGTRPAKTVMSRPDKSRDYGPDNYQWVTIKEKASDRINNVYLTHDGRTMTQSDWARELGITREGLRHRRHATNDPDMWFSHTRIKRGRGKSKTKCVEIRNKCE